jgi:hypothetical protein
MSRRRALQVALACLFAATGLVGVCGCGSSSTGLGHTKVASENGEETPGVDSKSEETAEEAAAKKREAEANKKEAAEEAELKKKQEASRKAAEAEEAQTAEKPPASRRGHVANGTKSRAAGSDRSGKHSPVPGTRRPEISLATEKAASEKAAEAAAQKIAAKEEDAEVRAFKKAEREEAAGAHS